ncbi:aprataxin and PNK-like factor isoform X1 [Ictalurus punctatus]|uniref:Aprataxin and PNK-like factor isoform X1 n=1 Tax=Ictalurus punctatus TaxID=7998 RepID=A0A2D0Q5S6_ICTPU|nr:aprataxin and PNK-like factor isoform X1 [Ictalurus punctatus]XP_017312704.1 aprataxin and PNK-like factor isoform X1 [Ictalurus punctatus]XP_017312705.1 aprataxin and PNK-like factor isoform X1 [Ictalurus punctatus]
MPGFELEQVDGGVGGEPIDLPHGDTVIGRGPFLSVSDKRVSRNHGILENVDGRLRLKPTHVNPCFVQTSPDASPRPLEEDRWHCLKDGSIFSLLPGKYIYRVRAVAEERTPRNSQGFEEEEADDEVMEIEMVSETEQNSKSSRSCEETLAYTPQAKDSPSFVYESTTRADPAASKQVGGDPLSSCKSDTPNSLTPRKQRVLPAWMMDVAPAALNTSPAKAAAKRAPARTVRNTPSSKHPAGPKRPRARPPSLSGDEDEEKGVEEEEEDVEEGCSKAPRKRARRLRSDPEESQQDQVPVPKSSRRRPAEDEDADAAQKTDDGENVNESKRAEDSQRSKAGGSTLMREGGENSQTGVQQKAKVQRRTPCPYGTSCYRKNPIHFQECSHPGDGDYEDEQDDEDGEDDDRPECPYGTDCYRKNPLHKKEYKHTQPPAKTTAPDDDDDGEEQDEDQYENSFVNDDSEEDAVDEDSDYVPESEDDGKEDVKRLKKEAEAFLQRKK